MNPVVLITGAGRGLGREVARQHAGHGRRLPGPDGHLPRRRGDGCAARRRGAAGIVCDSADRAACMVGWEPPGQDGGQDAGRVFETLWTADRDTARHAPRICCDLALDGARDLVQPIAEGLAEPVAHGPDELRRAEALSTRMIAYLAACR